MAKDRLIKNPDKEFEKYMRIFNSGKEHRTPSPGTLRLIDELKREHFAPLKEDSEIMKKMLVGEDGNNGIKGTVIALKNDMKWVKLIGGFSIVQGIALFITILTK